MSKIQKALNKLTKKTDKEILDLSKQREMRCIPVAREIIKRMGQDDLLVGTYKTSADDFELYYNGFVQKEILPVIAEADLLVSDIGYVFQLVDQAVALIKEKVNMTVELREEQAIAHLLGVKYTSDLRINKIQEILVSRDNPGLQS